jgi:hypothetical protein
MPTGSHEAFLSQQNDRLKFYNDDFWESAKFFSALTLLLLSAPFAVWSTDSRPLDWSLIVAGAPALGGLVAYVAFTVLRRTADSYYETGAAVVVLERQLGLHHVTGEQGDVPIVSARRLAQGQKSLEELASDFKGRLVGFFGSSRMSVVVKLFVFYGIVAAVETLTLVLHGLFRINLIAILKDLIT